MTQNGGWVWRSCVSKSWKYSIRVFEASRSLFEPAYFDAVDIKSRALSRTHISWSASPRDPPPHHLRYLAQILHNLSQPPTVPSVLGHTPLKSAAKPPLNLFLQFSASLSASQCINPTLAPLFSVIGSKTAQKQYCLNATRSSCPLPAHRIFSSCIVSASRAAAQMALYRVLAPWEIMGFIGMLIPGFDFCDFYRVIFIYWVIVKMNGSQVITVPKWALVLRIVQCFFAIVLLGISAYGLYWIAFSVCLSILWEIGLTILVMGIHVVHLSFHDNSRSL